MEEWARPQSSQRMSQFDLRAPFNLARSCTPTQPHKWNIVGGCGPPQPTYRSFVRHSRLRVPDDEHAGAASGFQDLRGWPDRAPQPRDVVAERRPEPARLQEIALHVDDDERAVLARKLGPIRLRLDPAHA